ncbi:MAG: hypothetical protein LBE12_18705 [Planctomycetaceae bacterium]|nr:hypothetical protein [Planctomycetaceae bacterium]
MSHADYYQNGNHSACDTINSPLSTTLSPHAGLCSVEHFDRRLRCATPTVMHFSSLRD